MPESIAHKQAQHPSNPQNKVHGDSLNCLSAIVAMVLLVIIQTSAEEKVFWQSEPEADPSPYKPFGVGCKVEIAEDSSIQATFDDSSPIEWCDKGVQVNFELPVEWEDFEYISCNYQVTPGSMSVGYYLHDKDGNFWHTPQTRDLRSQEWPVSGCKKSMFRFSYNEKHPDATSGEKQAPITYMFIYFRTLEVNTQTHYKALLKNIKLSSESSGVISKKTIKVNPGGLEKLAGVDAAAGHFPLQWRVKSMNSNGYLVVDGKPFFPLGLYSCIGIDQASATYEICSYTGPTNKGANIARLKAIKDAGFNLLQTYSMNLYGQKVSGPGWRNPERNTFPEEDGETTHELFREGAIKLMDNCQEVGLKLMIGAYSSYCISKPFPSVNRAEVWEKKKKVIEENVNTFKNHPALLVWYFIDEPSTVNMPVDDMMQCYQHIKRLDDVHPMFIASCTPLDEKYMNTIDIMGPDPYPIESEHPISEIMDRLDSLIKIQVGKPSMPVAWEVIQICPWKEGKRLPSAEEIRLMALLAMTRDVKGLLFWEHKNYPERNAQQWEVISNAVKSLHTVIPYILESQDIVKDYTASDKRVESIMRRLKNPKDGKPYYILVAVNPTQTQGKSMESVPLGRVTFILGNIEMDKGSVVTVIDEDEQGHLSLGKTRVIRLFKDENGFGFMDTFGGYASHIYKIGIH